MFATAVLLCLGLCFQVDDFKFSFCIFYFNDVEIQGDNFLKPKNYVIYHSSFYPFNTLCWPGGLPALG